MQQKQNQSRRKCVAPRPLSGEPQEELLPMRQHSLPHDVNHLCKRVSWLENFYEILYACQVEGVEIPFTVVYQYCRPYAAYLSEDGQLRKIESKDLEVPNPAMKNVQHSHQSTNLLVEFAEKAANKKSTLHKCDTGVEAMRVFSRDAILQGDKDLVVEYQTPEDAQNYLLYRPKEQNGIIQRFVQPSTPKVVSYRVYWTPYHMQVEAVCNNYLADAAELPVERRCCTFDGHQNDVSGYALNHAVEKKINDATGKIVTAVKRIMPKRVDIQVMMLHFKASSGGKLWFLYCSSLRLLDGSEGRPVPGAKLQIGLTDGEMKRRLYAVTTDRPRTARAEEPQLPPAKGRAAQKRKGRVCILSGTSLGKDGHLKYTATFQDVMLHFLWHGLSVGFEKVLNKTASAKALQDEERVGRMQKLSSSSPVRRSLRNLLTGDPSSPLLFVKDPVAAQKAMDEDEVLRGSYRLWQDAMTLVLGLVLDNLVEESFNQKKNTAVFLQHEAPVCEDVLLALSSSLSQLLVGWDHSQHSQHASRARQAKQRGSPDHLKRAGAASRADKENTQHESARSRRSSSCPPGNVGVDLGASKSNKSVKWGQVEEQRVIVTSSGECGYLSGKEAREIATYLMKENPSFFGSMHGSRWRQPLPDGNRFIQNDINHTEYLYWFHLFASVGLARLDHKDTPALKMKAIDNPPPKEALSFQPGKHMTFNDLVEFLFAIELMPMRVSRASAAHVFHAINKDHSVNDDDVRNLDSNEFMQYMKKLVPQVVNAERARIEGAFDLIYEAATGRGGRDGKPAPPSMFLLGDHTRKLVVIDHVQLPKIHTYHEVDRSQRYLESKGNIQKMSSFTRDANDLIATSKVARRMLKNPARTAALGSGSRLDPRALMGPLPSSHKRIPWKPEVVAVQQTVDLAGHGSVVYSSSFGRQDLDSAATSVDGEL